MPESKEEEKEKVEEKEVESKQEWWKKIPLWMILLLIFAGYLLYKDRAPEEGFSINPLYVIGAIVLYLLMSKKYKVEGEILTPREAYIYTEREISLKQSWGQFNPMDTFNISPIINAQRRDGGGMYYEIGVTRKNPYKNPQYLKANIPMKGLEKGNVTFTESIVPFHGRERKDERTLFGISRKLRDDPMFEKLISK